MRCAFCVLQFKEPKRAAAAATRCEGPEFAARRGQLLQQSLLVLTLARSLEQVFGEPMPVAESQADALLKS